MTDQTTESVISQASTLNDDLELLDKTKPKPQNYANQQAYYDDLTRWFIDVGLKVKGTEKPAPTVKPAPTQTNQQDREIARAAYIVGCLILDGEITLDLKDVTSQEDFTQAVKTVSQALRCTEPDHSGEWPYLHWE